MTAAAGHGGEDGRHQKKKPFFLFPRQVRGEYLLLQATERSLSQFFCLHMHVRGGHLPLQASGRSPKGMAEGKGWSCSALEMLQIQLAAHLSHNGGVSHSMSVWSSSASVGCLRAGDDELSAS